jgi:hypothetical protein
LEIDESKEFQKLSKAEQADEEKAINSDIYSFFIDPVQK